MSHPVDTANLEMLKEVIGDDLKDILESFIQIAPDTLNHIRQAVESSNAEDLRLHAHTLKGSAANIGAIQLPALCLVMENKAKENNLVDLETDLAAVESENSAVLAFLQDYISQF